MTCSHPGYRRRCLAPHQLCVAHRPKPPSKPDPKRRVHDQAYQARQRRRAAAGLPAGWVV